MKKGKNIKYVSMFLSLIVFAIFFVTCSNAVLTKEGKEDTEREDRKIVARVNGQPIYEDALTPYVRREMKKFQKYGAKRNTSALEKRMKRRALDKVIAQELVKQESRKLQIKDMNKKIEEKFKELKSRDHSEEKFASFLEKKGLTEKDIRESVKSKIYVEEYLELKGIQNPEVPDEEIREYYERNKEGFRRKEYIRASHILIMVKEDADSEEKEQSRAKAERIRKEIVEGKDFAEMAKEFSEDGRASQGGDLGYINRGYMPPEFDQVAFSLEKGALSEIVQTRHGFHIIKILDKRPEGIAPYEDVKDFIGRYLQKELAKRKHDLHIKELKSKAEIEILLNEL